MLFKIKLISKGGMMFCFNSALIAKTNFFSLKKLRYISTCLYCLSVATFFLLMFSSPRVLAHGEDKLGPHGGYIKMPGAFHTELVPLGKDKLSIYLLDINWENPSTIDSAVELKLISKKDKKSINCIKSVEKYDCTLPKGSLLKVGTLELKATREGQKGNQVDYKLPLKLQKAENNHNTHH